MPAFRSIEASAKISLRDGMASSALVGGADREVWPFLLFPLVAEIRDGVFGVPGLQAYPIDAGTHGFLVLQLSLYVAPACTIFSLKARRRRGMRESGRSPRLWPFYNSSIEATSFVHRCGR